MFDFLYQNNNAKAKASKFPHFSLKNEVNKNKSVRNDVHIVQTAQNFKNE